MKDWLIEEVRTAEQIAETASLASAIWREHYASLLSAEQIEYMLDRFQSEKAISEAIRKEDYLYYIFRNKGKAAGFFAFRSDGDSLFLSKIYLLKEERGKGFAGIILDFMKERCRKEGKRSIWLTVNRGNASSIAAYRHLGFFVEREQVTPIGGGFVMDDYVMRCCVEE